MATRQAITYVRYFSHLKLNPSKLCCIGLTNHLFSHNNAFPNIARYIPVFLRLFKNIFRFNSQLLIARHPSLNCRIYCVFRTGRNASAQLVSLIDRGSICVARQRTPSPNGWAPLFQLTTQPTASGR